MALTAPNMLVLMLCPCLSVCLFVVYVFQAAAGGASPGQSPAGEPLCHMRLHPGASRGGEGGAGLHNTGLDTPLL